ncbi:hypothetical protein [Petrachloros mirabilis]
MNRNRMSLKWAIVIGLLMLNLVIGLWPIQETSSAQETKRFIYQVVDVSGDTQALQTVLNDYGSRGWELVAVAMGEIQVPRLIFKK